MSVILINLFVFFWIPWQLDYDRIKKIAVDNEGNKDYFLSKFVQTQVFSYFIEQFYY